MQNKWYILTLAGMTSILIATDMQAPSQNELLTNQLIAGSKQVLREDPTLAPQGREQAHDQHDVTHERAAVVQKFRAERETAIKLNISNLAAKRNAAEKGLREAVKTSESNTSGYLGALAHWAKVNAALQEEEEVLAFVSGIPDNVQDGEITLAVEQADAMKNAYGKVEKDYVATKLNAWQKIIKHGPGKDGITLEQGLKEARDAVAAYYEVISGLYRDANQMLEGLWSASAHEFETVKDLEIEDALTDATRLTELRIQRASIWQGADKARVLGKRELVEQRKADLGRALERKKEARKAKGKISDENHPFGASSQKAERCRNAYEKDRGRLAAQEMLLKAHEDLRLTISHIRDIDEKTPDQTEKSRRGVRVLKREAGLVVTPGSMGTSTNIIMRVASVIGRKIGNIAEMEPVRVDFENRVSYLRQIFPQIDFGIAGARWAIRTLAPGLLQEV